LFLPKNIYLKIFNQFDLWLKLLTQGLSFNSIEKIISTAFYKMHLFNLILTGTYIKNFVHLAL